MIEALFVYVLLGCLIVAAVSGLLAFFLWTFEPLIPVLAASWLALGSLVQKLQRPQP